jgi:hypothetical protein
MVKEALDIPQGRYRVYGRFQHWWKSHTGRLPPAPPVGWLHAAEGSCRTGRLKSPYTLSGARSNFGAI